MSFVAAFGAEAIREAHRRQAATVRLFAVLPTPFDANAVQREIDHRTSLFSSRTRAIESVGDDVIAGRWIP